MSLRDGKWFSRKQTGLVLQQMACARTAKNTKVKWTSQA